MREYPKQKREPYANGVDYWSRSERDSRTGYSKAPNPDMAPMNAVGGREYPKGQRAPAALKHEVPQRFERTAHLWGGGMADRTGDPSAGAEIGAAYEAGNAAIESMGGLDKFSSESYYGGEGGGGVMNDAAATAAGQWGADTAQAYGGPAASTGPAAPEGYIGSDLVGSAEYNAPAMPEQSTQAADMTEALASQALGMGSEMQAPAMPSGPSFRETEIEADKLGAAYDMGRAMLGEARNQGPAGMAAVGNVIANRTEAGRNGYLGLGKTVQDQLTKSQFSYLGDQNKKAADKAMAGPQGDIAYAIGKGIVNKTLPDNTRGALSYRAQGGFDRSYQALKAKHGVEQIGDHYFTEFGKPRGGVDQRSLSDEDIADILGGGN